MLAMLISESTVSWLGMFVINNKEILKKRIDIFISLEEATLIFYGDLSIKKKQRFDIYCVTVVLIPTNPYENKLCVCA